MSLSTPTSADRHRAAALLGLPVVGSGYKRKPADDALIDRFLWVKPQIPDDAWAVEIARAPLEPGQVLAHGHGIISLDRIRELVSEGQPLRIWIEPYTMQEALIGLIAPKCADHLHT